MKVYDCDNEEHFKILQTLEEEKQLVKNNQLQSFGPCLLYTSDAADE